MGRIVIERNIDARIENVFETISEIQNFAKAIPHIVNVEFLTDSQKGVGTRFRETRMMKGKEVATELEVTEHVPNEKVRMVTDNHGTVWDTVFEVRADGDSTHLKMTMDSRSYKLMPKLMLPLVNGMIRKAVEADMDSVKVYCEQAKQSG